MASSVEEMETVEAPLPGSAESDLPGDGDSDSSSGDGESESSSDDSDQEAAEEEEVVNADELEKQIADLQTQIDGNPYIYDKHTQLITSLRSLGCKDRLRAAREQMSLLFPLTEALWLEWLKDEDGNPDKTKLLERATADYTSVNLWMECVYHSMKGMSEPDGIANVRAAFENAISAVGLNVAKGSTVWDAYREFEIAVLAGLQPQPGSTETKDFDAQLNLVTRLFKRQLSIPLMGMENTFNEYKSWIEGDVEEETQSSYNKALSVLEKLKPFEDSLSKSDSQRLDIYNKYIAFEISYGNSARIQCLFERAIEENCLVPDLWIQYTEYLERKKNPSEVLLPVYRRSVRNCSWSVDLWVGYMRSLEMFDQPKDDIKRVFNEAMSVGFAQASEYLELWTAYIDFLKRRIDWNSEHGSKLEELRNAFEDATNQLYRSYHLDGDPKCSLSKCWAYIEARFCRNMSKSRELWSQIMQSGYETDPQMWMEYVNHERAFGDVKHCRRVFQRALNSVQDWPEIICDAFLRFEREEGNLHSFQAASIMCKDKMKQTASLRAEEEKKRSKLIDQKKKGKPGSKFEKSLPTRRNERGSSEFKQQQQQQQPLQPYQRTKKNDSSKKPVDTQGASSGDHAGPVVYVRGATQKRKFDEIASAPSIPPEAARVLDEEGFKIPPPPLIGEVTKSRSAPPGFTPRSTHTGEKSVSESTEPPAKRPKGEQMNVVFISNLDYNVSDEELKEVFSKVGLIKEVKLATNPKTHTSRGFGHIEFVDELAAGEALKMDRTLINGRPVFVSKFEPGETNRSKFRFDVGLEKKKLFVRGLPPSLTEEQLKAEFSKHGKVITVRLVTYRSGKPKGLAYVEYETEELASQAVLKMDGQQIQGCQISVALSHPPPRNAPATNKPSEFVPSLGGGKKDNRNSTARPQLSLVPRALQRNTAPSNQKKDEATASATRETSSENGTEQNKQSPLTNTDFRNMLLKK